MLPENNTYGEWPLSGEIDIVESRGNGISYTKQYVSYLFPLSSNILINLFLSSLFNRISISEAATSFERHSTGVQQFS